MVQAKTDQYTMGVIGHNPLKEEQASQCLRSLSIEVPEFVREIGKGILYVISCFSFLVGLSKIFRCLSDDTETESRYWFRLLSARL